ncbi:putative integral membrane protein (TIGR00698 family) [Desulfohalotomaculum tongense]|uniref:YeiH family protein n=1 Tax=Desulforadius tongensis TaxID=1216062 RepID=UPI00195C7977|nr:putative sulfate exporter family transporter [Desulforadius tongensis]MBM7854875.1 putative integral membrane protein (TIGR00698 family) [Desulforadius tongensis]
MPSNKALLVIKTIPGILLMLAIAVFTRGASDFGFPQWPGIEAYFASNEHSQKFLIDILHLNYILLSIIIGMLIRNIFTIPAWAVTGIKTSSLFIKLGVILLGSMYSVVDVARLGGTGIIIVSVFVILTLSFTLWLAKKADMDPASAAVLSAGTAICGVSAIIAAAPAVRAKTTDVVYSIATILSFGVACLFIFPLVGTLVGLSPHQFGVWAGTGILNSGQILAACLTFDPETAHHASVSLKTGQIYNIIRVIFLPFVVLILAVFTTRSAPLEGDDININTSLWSRFPVFVIGFLVMVFLTSFGLLGQTSPPSPELIFIRKLYSWFFAIGLAGLGMQISFSELRRAGGKPLAVGTAAAVFKAVGALVVVMLLISEQP